MPIDPLLRRLKQENRLSMGGRGARSQYQAIALQPGLQSKIPSQKKKMLITYLIHVDILR